MRISDWSSDVCSSDLQCGLLRGVFHQASEADFRITKLALDHPEWMLNLGPDLSFRVFDFAAHATDQALFCMLLIAAGARCDRPDHLAMLMLRTLLHAGVNGIARAVSFLAMQQLIDLSHVRHIRRRAHHAMDQ